jgi:hypothetical protein
VPTSRIPRDPIESCSNLGLGRNIPNTTKEVELVWKAEPGPRSRASQNGQSEQPAVEDDRLLDHHIEEILGTFTAAARMRDSNPDPGEQRRD